MKRPRAPATPAEIEGRRALQQLGDQLRPKIDAEQLGPNLQWARDIVARKRGGQQVSSATLKMAQDALAARGEDARV